MNWWNKNLTSAQRQKPVSTNQKKKKKEKKKERNGIK